jgi:hypothetical protein
VAFDALKICTILHDEYFDRLWVVQEFILAKTARILVKDARLPGIQHDWQNQTDPNTSSTLHPFMAAHKSLGAAQLLATKQNTRYHSNPMRYEPLEDLLIRYRDQECVDPRDRVYGLLGLADPRFDIAVDYGKLPQQVFMDAILVIVIDEAGPLPNQPLRWTREGDSQQTCAFAEQMECTGPQLQSLRVLMKVLWSPMRRLAYKGRQCPFTATGFEPADALFGSQDRWWLDYYGVRYYVECEDKVPQGGILRLLEEDLERIRVEDEDDGNWKAEDEDEEMVSHQARLYYLLGFLKTL